MDSYDLLLELIEELGEGVNIIGDRIFPGKVEVDFLESGKPYTAWVILEDQTRNFYLIDDGSVQHISTKVEPYQITMDEMEYRHLRSSQENSLTEMFSKLQV